MATLQRETDVAATRDAVVAGLSAYNASVVGSRNSVPLALSLRDDDGVIVGGLIGELKWQWLHVDLLWIDDAHRGKGHGEALVAMAENTARDHGARGVYLSTMSLQAPDFYPKLGYRQYGVMEDYPVVGHRIHHFAKAL
ncbi:MAG: GNAT family N-acetyltransferase [Hyphomicrobiales bacterium]|nr:MAG: GNAT family N-acetyltransferase [Hyphomicrobiales bacterium]